jgi:hypothetical protein
MRIINYVNLSQNVPNIFFVCFLESFTVFDIIKKIVAACNNDVLFLWNKCGENFME